MEQEEDVLSYALFPQVAMKFFEARKAARNPSLWNPLPRLQRRLRLRPRPRPLHRRPPALLPCMWRISPSNSSKELKSKGTGFPVPSACRETLTNRRSQPF